MSSKNEMDSARVLDAFGELIAAVAALAAQVPATSFSAIPGGIRPTEEAIDKYETVVYRFRDQAGPPYRVLYAFYVDSLEAFEAGRIFDAVPPLLQGIERLVDLHKEEKVQFNSAEQNRIREFQTAPRKNSPGSQQARSGSSHPRNLLTRSK